MADVFSVQLQRQVRYLKANGTEAEVEAVRAALHAIQHDPHRHDGPQPGIGFDDAVRRKVPDTGYRILYRTEDDGSVMFLALFTVPNSGSTYVPL